MPPPPLTFPKSEYCSIWPNLGTLLTELTRPDNALDNASNLGAPPKKTQSNYAIMTLDTIIASEQHVYQTIENAV